MQRINPGWMALALFCVIGCFAAAQAGEPTMTANPASGAPTIAGFGRSVDAAALARLSGGADISAVITVIGTVDKNSIISLNTGSNAIGGGAFANSVGLPMVIQNTGNGVLIQSATLIDVQIQQ